MKWTDIVSAALNNLLRRKLRSALTMLGVVIGTAAIVVTISLGYGAEQTQMEALESYTNLRQITVYPFWSYRSSDTNQNRITRITDSVVDRMRRVDGVDAVTPVQMLYNLGGEPVLMSGKYETSYVTLVAVSPTDFAKFKDIKSGKTFTGSTDKMEFIMSEMAMMDFGDPEKDEDERPDAYSLLMEGKNLEDYLPKINWLKDNFTFRLRWEEYETDSADVDAEPKQYNKDFKAKMVGTLAADLEDYDYMFSYSAIVNINWVKRMMKDNKALFKEWGIDPITSYDTVYVLAESVNDVERVFNSLTEMGLQPQSKLQEVNNFKRQIQTMQAFLGFIGMISMLVAALSIANTMMMSIYERTREIGVMKVLGCKLGNIRLMFLSEAAYIGIFGGALGLILSYLLSYALNNVGWLKDIISTVMVSTQTFSQTSGTTSIIPVELSLATWLGVVVVSILSGVQPAQRAMRLSSLAAIRSSE